MSIFFWVVTFIICYHCLFMCCHCLQGPFSNPDNISVSFLYIFLNCIIYNSSFFNNLCWINFYGFSSCRFLQPGESSFWHPHWVLYSGKLPYDDCRSKVCFGESSCLMKFSLARWKLRFLCSRIFFLQIWFYE